MDIPGASMNVTGLPAAPDGYEVDRVDVIVRLRRCRALPAPVIAAELQAAALGG